ncbi:MAG: family 43 glycosylhydrolase, partial [Bacteroidales bacterium]|nr:family 43 glycosylhydrolase [Bacteroidales bacterium]
MTYKNILLALLVALLTACNSEKRPSRPEFDPNYPDVHDPVLAVGEDGRYYIFSTGVGVSVMSSADLKTWRQEQPVFAREEIPQWAKDTVPGYWGHTWAPDISYRNGKWHLYYSCSTFGRNGSTIGLAINKTLDPTSPDFHWIDQGPVVVSHPDIDNWNAIDPNLCEDYLVWGSFWDGLQLQQLDSDLKTRLGEPVTIARRIDRHRELSEIPITIEGKDTIKAGDNAIEGPFIFKRGDWYYLLVSLDYCCRGKNSTYKTSYGRSSSITGPYLDQ